MKINKSTFDSLPAGPLKDSFKPVSGNADEYDNGEENVSGLRTALEKEKEEKRTIKDKLTDFESKQAAAIEKAKADALKQARESGDFAAIEKDYKERLAASDKALAELRTANENAARSAAIGKAVDQLAGLFVAPELAKPFLRSRLLAEKTESGEFVIRISDKDGKPTAATIEDFKKEILTTADFKASLVASKGTGGGSGVPGAGGGSGATDGKPVDLTKLDAKALADHLEASGKVKTSEG